MYGNANFLERSESELEEDNDERGIISEDDGLEGDDDDEIGNLMFVWLSKLSFKYMLSG